MPPAYTVFLLFGYIDIILYRVTSPLFFSRYTRAVLATLQSGRDTLGSRITGYKDRVSFAGSPRKRLFIR